MDHPHEDAGAAATAPAEERPSHVMEAVGVTKHFRGVHALDGVSLRIGGGEIVGLIGPNGSGKTTLLNVLSGVYAPTAGKVICDGREVEGFRPNRIAHMGVGRTFQNIRLFDHLTVRQNVEVGSVSGHASKGVDHRADVDRLLARFGLSASADVQALNLPYGAQRRVEIARALAGRPYFLLLDEPAAGMNPQETKELMKLIAFVRERFQLTILLIEHDMSLVMGICERIVVLDYGQMIAMGSPTEISRNPAVIKAYLGEEEI